MPLRQNATAKDSPLIQHALAMFYSDYRNWADAARWEEKFAYSERGGQGRLSALGLPLPGSGHAAEGDRGSARGIGKERVSATA